jgi:hypothetical protein
MQPNTLARREHKGKIVLRILEKIHEGSGTESGPEAN